MILPQHIFLSEKNINIKFKSNGYGIRIFSVFVTYVCECLSIKKVHSVWPIFNYSEKKTQTQQIKSSSINGQLFHFNLLFDSSNHFLLFIMRCTISKRIHGIMRLTDTHTHTYFTGSQLNMHRYHRYRVTYMNTFEISSENKNCQLTYRNEQKQKWLEGAKMTWEKQ